MSQIDSIRELSATEIDEVAGGLSIGATAGVTTGVSVNANDVFSEVNTLVKDAGSLVTGLVGSALGAVGGVTSGL